MSIKIAVVYNNEPKLCKYVKQHPDIYVPILAGRIWTKKSYDIPNLLYDDVGDNISWLNPYINEMTAIYWVGHHFDAVGNPDYIGFQHYRRLFNLDNVLPYLGKGTLILNEETLMLSMVDFLEMCHGVGRYLVSLARDILRLDDPNIDRLFNEFAFSRTYYSRNLFVVHKDVFFGLVEYITMILKYAAKDINFDVLGTPGARNIGFVMERMVGFYFLLLHKQYGFNVHPTMFGYVDEKELK